MIWLPLLLLPARLDSSIEQQYSETVFETKFDQSSDTNYDNWPDGWTRRKGTGFPHYVKIEIDDNGGMSNQSQCLRIELNGGGAIAYTPPIEINPVFNYVFQGQIKTEGLKHNLAFFTISFFDRERTERETYTSDKLTTTSGWQELRIGPLIPENPDVELAVIGLHLVPTIQSDLTGAAMFDNIRFARLPNMTLETEHPDNMYRKPGTTPITYTVSGIKQPKAPVQFELVGVNGRILDSEQLKLSQCSQSDDPLPHHKHFSPGGSSSVPAGSGYVGCVTWRPRLPDYGYFTVRASLGKNGKVTLQKSTSLVVLQRPDLQRKGEFGWSIARKNAKLPGKKLVSLLQTANASWVKYPIWYAPRDAEAETERIGALADQLSATEIEMVGVLDQPPEKACKAIWKKDHLTAAEAVLEPDTWGLTIDKLLVEFSLKIQWWQLGADGDDSFIDFNGLQTKLTKLRSHLRRFGQRVRLGMAWRWTHEVPQWSAPPWDFMAMSESPSFTQKELSTYVSHSEAESVPRWVTLRPLPRENYDSLTRARDLILRMIAAKVEGAQAIFTADVFDPSRGLVNTDGSPNDLFLPWCITSRMLSGADYLGSLQLPHGSTNHLFARDGQAVLAVWNQTPVTESLYLGNDVVQIDPWGRKTVLSDSEQPTDEPQEVAAGPLPTFVTGLNLAVARWRLSTTFKPDQLVSKFGHYQSSSYQFKNTFAQGLGGTVKLDGPDVWDVRNSNLRFKLGNDEEFQRDFSVLLHTHASSGPQPVSLDFEVFAKKEHRFKVFRTIDVGMGDLVAELNTWVDKKGSLIVEQHLMNQTDQRFDLNCYLFIPGRRRMRMQVFDIGPGHVTQTYTLRNGRELLGKSLWLRVEELKGDRLYNYHVVAKP